MATTNKELLERLLEIEKKLPNGELEELKIHLNTLSSEQKEHATKMEEVHRDVTELKYKLLDPEEGLVVKTNKNTYWRKQVNPENVKDLLQFRNNVTKALWILFTAIVGICAQLIFG